MVTWLAVELWNATLKEVAGVPQTRLLSDESSAAASLRQGEIVTSVSGKITLLDDGIEQFNYSCPIQISRI